MFASYKGKKSEPFQKKLNSFSLRAELRNYWAESSLGVLVSIVANFVLLAVMLVSLALSLRSQGMLSFRIAHKAWECEEWRMIGGFSDG